MFNRYILLTIINVCLDIFFFLIEHRNKISVLKNYLDIDKL